MLTNNTLIPPQEEPADEDNTVLILTSDGGQGHISAAMAERNLYKQSHIVNVIDENFISLDVINDKVQFTKYLPGIYLFLKYNWGKFGTDSWNIAQQNGDVKKLQALFAKQALADKLFAYNYFHKMSSLLAAYPKTKLVITTQPNALVEIQHAIAIYNDNFHHQDGEKIAYKVVLTDTLTEKSLHFLQPLSQIDDSFLSCVKLIISAPTPATNLSKPALADYHAKFKSLCPNLYIEGTTIPKPNIEIRFTDGPIDVLSFKAIADDIKKQGYNEVNKQYRHQPLPVKLSSHAIKVMSKAPWLKHYFKSVESETSLMLNPDANITTIMLGSKASKEGTLRALEFEYLLHQKSNTQNMIFVFCGNDEDLFTQVLAKSEEYAKNSQVLVVPLSSQDKPMIGKLYTMADTIVTRPGGMSIMEIKSVAHANIVVYAEIIDQIPMTVQINRPEASLLIWEQGNYEDIKNTFGSERVCVVNNATYLDRRKAQLNRQQSDDQFIILDDHIRAVFQEPQLRKTCELLRPNADNNQLQTFLLGAAIYHSKGYHSLLELSVFANMFVIANNIYATQSEEKYDTRIMPSGWTMKFMDYIETIITSYHQTHPVPTTKELTMLTENGTAEATIYANAFYDKALNICSKSEVDCFLAAYKNTNTESAQEKHDAGSKALKNYRDKIYEAIGDKGNINETWNDKESIVSNVRSIITHYTHPYFSFFRRRHHIKEAEQLLSEVETWSKTLSPFQILDRLISFKANLMLRDDLNPHGDFINRIRFMISAIGKIAVQDSNHEAQLNQQDKLPISAMR